MKTKTQKTTKAAAEKPIRTLRITVKNQPYLAKQYADGGWVVSANSSRTDRFHRNYSVKTSPSGDPVSCTCNAFAYNGPCKHMDAVRTIRDQDDEAKDAEITAREVVNNVNPPVSTPEVVKKPTVTTAPHVYSTAGMRYEKAVNTLTTDNLFLGFVEGNWPNRIVLESHKSLNRRTFSLATINTVGGKLQWVDYSSNGMTLRIVFK